MKTKEQKLTAADIRDKLSIDSVSIRKGVATVRRGFFYTHGKTAQDLADTVLRQYPDADILDSGEVWKAFRGGASVAASSHWFVKFQLKAKEV